MAFEKSIKYEHSCKILYLALIKLIFFILFDSVYIWPLYVRFCFDAIALFNLSVSYVSAIYTGHYVSKWH